MLNCQAKLKTVPEYEKEILEDIRAIQLSENREEFQESNTMFYVKWLSLGIEKRTNLLVTIINNGSIQEKVIGLLGLAQ